MNQISTEVIFPVRLSDGILGETININDKIAELDLEKRLPIITFATLYIKLPNLSVLETLEIRIQVAENKIKNNRVWCKVNFLQIKENWPLFLQDAICKYKSLNREFISLTKDIRGFLQKIKCEFDEFDKLKPDERKQIEFIRANKKKVFNKLDSHFNQIWKIVRNFDKENYRLHQIYYQQMFYDLFGPSIETNWHIYRKPFGYCGDYLMMNYIYDYYGDDRYLGESSYEKLINNYTCNIPFSSSNIRRKEFLKEKILEIIKRKDEAKITSVGCGPARELVELLNENRIKKPVFFKCLDFEEKALEYLKSEIKEIPKTKKEFLTIQYIHKNIIDIVVNRKIKEEINNQDLIYVAGVFDYLGTHFCARLTKQLFQLLDKNGILIICNASQENITHRAYYEMLGEWNMHHRTKKEMLEWTKGLRESYKIIFEESKGCNNYLFLTIKKQ